MASKQTHSSLSRRERQIMDILYQRGRAGGAEIHAALPDRPSYSAVRAKLRVLEEKGHVRHEEEALRYVYLPTMARDTARRSALRHMVSTFFEGSVEEAVAALLGFRFSTSPTAIIAARRRRGFFNRATARATADNFSP